MIVVDDGVGLVAEHHANHDDRDDDNWRCGGCGGGDDGGAASRDRAGGAGATSRPCAATYSDGLCSNGPYSYG